VRRNGGMNKGKRCDDMWVFEHAVSTSSNPMLEDNPLLATRDCFLIIFAATCYVGGRSSIRNLRS